MNPPDLFYYNLGEWFKDMAEYNEAGSSDGDYFSFGARVAQFFLGAKSVLNDDFLAFKLAGEFLNFMTTGEDAPEEPDKK